MEPIRVLIADDHAIFRRGLCSLLSAVPDIEIIGEAATGEEAIAQAAMLEPDVILMDLQMPDFNGIEATRRILRKSPHIGILVLTMFEDDDSIFTAMRTGARGYLLKGADQTEIVRAIKAVDSGEAIFSPSIAQWLMRYFAALKSSSTAQVFPELTEREREVLALIAQGRSNPEIANRLILSSKTVRNYVSNIFSKLQVADRAQAIILARDAGLGKEK